MPKFEPVTDIEACGRAAALLLVFIGQRVAEGQFPTPDQLGDFAEDRIYDDDRISPNIKEFYKGLMEGLSVATDGGPDATL